MNLREIGRKAWMISEAKGFHALKRTVGESLLLIHTEISEATEDLRNNKIELTIREDGKPEGFPSELADIIIRTAHLAEEMHIDLQQEVERKLEYNQYRPYLHGGKTM